MTKLKSNAFTLMEMLLVTTLVALISVAIFSAFSNGLKLWAKGVVLDHEGDLSIALDKMAEDVRSIVPMSGFLFKGTQMRVAFPSIVWTTADRKSSRAKEGTVDQIGAVEYYFEPAEGIIYRRQANYGQSLKKQWGQSQGLVSGVEELRFSYSVQGGRVSMVKSQLEAQVPLGIFIEIRLKGDAPDHWLKQYMPVVSGG